MKKREIKINIAMKSLTSRGVKEYPFLLLNTPETLRELIEESVRACVRSYKARGEQGENPRPLTDEEISGMQTVGRLAFGVHYNEADIDEENAIVVATEAVEDGIVRIFREDKELSDFDSEITVNEGDVFTFVRLTMLSGRMW